MTYREAVEKLDIFEAELKNAAEKKLPVRLSPEDAAELYEALNITAN